MRGGTDAKPLWPCALDEPPRRNVVDAHQREGVDPWVRMFVSLRDRLNRQTGTGAKLLKVLGLLRTEMRMKKLNVPVEVGQVSEVRLDHAGAPTNPREPRQRIEHGLDDRTAAHAV